MTTIATMTLVQAGETRCLAGHHVDGDSVLVLRKQSDTDYELHAVPIDTAEQSLRSILSAKQSEHGELVAAILATVSEPHSRSKRTPRVKHSKRSTKRKVSR